MKEDGVAQTGTGWGRCEDVVGMWFVWAGGVVLRQLATIGFFGDNRDLEVFGVFGFDRLGVYIVVGLFTDGDI